MEILSVIVAAVAAFAFGAVWYMSLSAQWIRASGVPVGPDGKPANNTSKAPFVIGILAMIVVAGMMRHIFGMAGIDSLGKGALAGLGTGAFIAVPWLAMNYGFAGRAPALTLIDGANCVAGCTIMGSVLGLM